MTTRLCDTNVWLALSISGHVHHDAARRWFETVDEPASVQFCRVTQHSLLRLLTRAAIFKQFGDPPLTNSEAWAVYEAFREDDRIGLQVPEPDGLEIIWRQFTLRRTPSPKLWMDAYLAAFARANGWQIVTADGAFRQFTGLDLLVLAD